MLDILTYLIAYGVAPVVAIALSYEIKRKNNEIKEMRRLVNDERQTFKNIIEELTATYKAIYDELKKELLNQ